MVKGINNILKNLALLQSPSFQSTVRFILMTRSGCLKKNTCRYTTTGKKSLKKKRKHLIVGILASCFTGPCLFPGTHKCMYFISRSLSPSCCYKSILLNVDTVYAH